MANNCCFDNYSVSNFKDGNDFVWNLDLEDLRENEKQAPKRGLDNIIESAAKRAGNQPFVS